MADIPINPVTRRVEFTGNTGTGPFAFTFNVLAQADIAAYKNNTLLALTSDYTVSLNSNGTGSITLVAALIASDELVIIGDLPLSRTTDFVTAGDLLASSLNQQFDSNVVMSQQLDERFDRTIRSQPGDINKNLYLPLVSSRASQLLSFDSSGNITTTSLANVPDIGTVNLSVSGVASFADGSASAPSITNIGDTNTGMYFGAADQINFSIGGSEVISISSTGTTISGLSISSGDILLTDNSATALEIKEGSNNYLTFITTNGSEKLSFGSTANPTFEVNGSFRQPLIAATTSFFSQTYSGATLSATNGAVNIESYSASKAGIVLNGSGDQITFTSPTLGFVGLVQVVGAITTDTSLNIASSTTVDGILDEDNMASNSATKLATQQSIKAYVDAQVGTVDTLAEVLGNGNTTGSNNIIVTAGQSITVDTISETTAANGVVIDGVTLKDGGATVTADVSFGTNDKAIFGAGSDLQIYHDGANSYIQDAGTGALGLFGSTFVGLYETGSGDKMVIANGGSDVELYYDNAPKLATTATGIDVTGTVTADGLTVDGNVLVQAGNGATATLSLNNGDGNGTLSQLNLGYTADPDHGNIQYTGDMILSTGGNKDRLKIANNGDISFYEDTGTTAKFFWDADAESLGIGTTTAPSSSDVKQVISSSTGAFSQYSYNGGAGSAIGSPAASTFSVYTTTGSIGSETYTERMRIDSSGNVGIGLSSNIGATLHVDPAANVTTAFGTPLIKVGGANSWAGNGSIYSIGFGYNNGSTVKSPAEIGFDTTSATGVTKGDLVFATRDVTTDTAPTERMRITSGGNLLVGTTSSTGGGRLELKGSGTGAYVPTGYNGNNVNSVRIVSGGSPSTSDTVGISMGIGGGAEGYFGIVQDSSGYANFVFNSYNGSYAERMRIDSSGNVLVGHTAEGTWDANNSAILRASGVATFTSTSTPPLYANLLTSDGDIVQFRKDGAPVGSIGVGGGRPHFVANDGSTGGGFRVDSTQFYPVDRVGTTSNGVLNLGANNARWKDLFLSGGVYLGGIVAANKLDDYESGTFTYSGSSTNLTSLSTSERRYIKIGDQVTLWMKASFDVTAADTRTYIALTLPFNTATNTTVISGGGLIEGPNPFKGISAGGGDSSTSTSTAGYWSFIPITTGTHTGFLNLTYVAA